MKNKIAIMGACAGAGTVIGGVPQGLLIGTLAGAAGVTFLEKGKREDVFGNARFANFREIQKAGLFSTDGIILGTYNKRLIRYDGDRHVLVIAPTRSGKGVGIIIPTLLATDESVFVIDIKGENWKRTAGKRSEYGPVYKFEPDQRGGSCYNLLDDVRWGESEVGDLQAISHVLCHEPNVKDPYWNDAAKCLLTATFLALHYTGAECSLGGALRFLASPGFTHSERIQTLFETKCLRSEALQYLGTSLINKTDNDLKNVFATVLVKLGLFFDPVVCENTSHSHFSLRELLNSDKPVSIYLVAEPNDIHQRLKPLIKLITDMVGRILCQGGVDKPRKQRVLLVLDEFTALGHLDFFDNALSYIAGYGVRAMVVCQTMQQLNQFYGPSQTISENCYLKVFMTPNSVETAQYISRYLGQKTVRYQTGNSLFPKNQQMTGRPLLSEEELLRFSNNDLLIFAAGRRPIRCKRIISHEHSFFKPHFKPAPGQTVFPPWEVDELVDADSPGAIYFKKDELE